MKNKRLLTPSEAAEELGISIRTLIRWDQAGKLRAVRTAGNQRRIPVEEIFRLRRQGEPQAQRCALYARVSSVRQEQAVDIVLIEYPDRLVRFGFRYLEQAFQWQHVRLEVLDQPQAQEPTEELMRDMLTIVTVFAGRLYGQRAKGLRSRVQSALSECEQEPGVRDGTGQAHQQTAP